MLHVQHGKKAQGVHQVISQPIIDHDTLANKELDVH